jgi:putative tricarboxylic transport membrane protein
METFLECVKAALQLQNLLIVTGGTLLGIICGAIPGLTATMSIALILPITFVLPADLGMAAILGVYIGATYGGSISAILINIPGTPASMMTGLDGYPMAQQGKAGTALGIATIASFIGGVLSGLILIFVAPALGSIALKFGPAEYFAIGVFSLSLIAGIAGKNIYKGLAAGLIGVSLNLVGSDPVTGVARYAFGNVYMTGGLTLVPILVGLFGFREVLKQSNEVHLKYSIIKQVNRILPSKEQILHMLPTTIRGGVIGTFIGILPGAGGPIASFVAYDTEKRISDKNKTFGTGDIRGIAASESANNGVNGGALVPLLTLGVPGDGATAVMLGAFMMNNITPGPMLFVNHAELVNSIYANYMLAAVLMLALGLLAARLFMKVIHIPQKILIPVIAILCFVGSYSVKRSIFDVWTMVAMGILGYLLDKRGFPVICTVLGAVLGNLIEVNFRSAIRLGNGNPLFILQKPIAAGILAVTAVMILWPFLRAKLSARKNQAAEQSK